MGPSIIATNNVSKDTGMLIREAASSNAATRWALLSEFKIGEQMSRVEDSNGANKTPSCNLWDTSPLLKAFLIALASFFAFAAALPCPRQDRKAAMPTPESTAEEKRNVKLMLVVC
jgi:hypothetical protein